MKQKDNFEKNLKETLEKKKEKKEIIDGWRVIPNKFIYDSKVLQRTFDDQEYYRFTDVKKIGQKVSNDLYKQKLPGLISISVKFSEIGWRSGKFTDVGDPVHVFAPSESDINDDVGKILKFKIVLLSKPSVDIQKMEKIRNLRNLKKMNKK